MQYCPSIFPHKLSRTNSFPGGRRELPGRCRGGKGGARVCLFVCFFVCPAGPRGPGREKRLFVCVCVCRAGPRGTEAHLSRESQPCSGGAAAVQQRWRRKDVSASGQLLGSPGSGQSPRKCLDSAGDPPARAGERAGPPQATRVSRCAVASYARLGAQFGGLDSDSPAGHPWR